MLVECEKVALQRFIIVCIEYSVVLSKCCTQASLRVAIHGYTVDRVAVSVNQKQHIRANIDQSLLVIVVSLHRICCRTLLLCKLHTTAALCIVGSRRT
jgi:hypothetical protein